MAISDIGRRGLVSEINVTPLVDVMLVLLIIFMISSSIETMQVQQEKERIKKTLTPPEERLDQKVPVSLPKTNADPVNLSEEKKLVLSINNNLEFFLGETVILRCLDVALEIKPLLGVKGKSPTPSEDKAFRKCLDNLEQRLSKNEKLRNDKELYLRADETVPYGLVLKVMARIRQSGVAKFGLIAEPER